MRKPEPLLRRGSPGSQVVAVLRRTVVARRTRTWTSAGLSLLGEIGEQVVEPAELRRGGGDRGSPASTWACRGRRTGGSTAKMTRASRTTRRGRAMRHQNLRREQIYPAALSARTGPDSPRHSATDLAHEMAQLGQQQLLEREPARVRRAGERDDDAAGVRCRSGRATASRRRRSPGTRASGIARRIRAAACRAAPPPPRTSNRAT